MRNMSFALTTDQVRAGTKTVTRRLGWLNLKPGQIVRPVRKAMGLRPGERIEPLRAPLRVVSVRREPLNRMIDDIDYGLEECKREGFGDHPQLCWPTQFVSFFCSTHKGCLPEHEVTRIEFEYLTDAVQTEPRTQSAIDIQLHGCRQHGRRDCKTC